MLMNGRWRLAKFWNAYFAPRWNARNTTSLCKQTIDFGESWSNEFTLSIVQHKGSAKWFRCFQIRISAMSSTTQTLQTERRGEARRCMLYSTRQDMTFSQLRRSQGSSCLVAQLSNFFPLPKEQSALLQEHFSRSPSGLPNRSRLLIQFYRVFLNAPSAYVPIPIKERLLPFNKYKYTIAHCCRWR